MLLSFSFLFFFFGHGYLPPTFTFIASAPKVRVKKKEIKRKKEGKFPATFSVCVPLQPKSNSVFFLRDAHIGGRFGGRGPSVGRWKEAGKGRERTRTREARERKGEQRRGSPLAPSFENCRHKNLYTRTLGSGRVPRSAHSKPPATTFSNTSSLYSFFSLPRVLRIRFFHFIIIVIIEPFLRFTAKV